MFSFWSIGVAVSLYLVYQVVRWTYLNFFKPVDLSAYIRGQSWAIVTGATDGIGLAYAQVLAEHGFNILLVSRTQSKLEDVKARIQSKCRVQVDFVVNEAYDISEANIARVVERCAGKDISVLVNNVGVNQGGIKLLSELDSANIERCIRINCTYPTLLTKALIPIILKHQGRKLVINVSSVAGLLMIPFSCVYSGSKAYNRQFSLALSAEYASRHLDVLCVEPGFVESNMTKMKPSAICCSARDCVEASLRRVREIECIPHWKHILMYMVSMVGQLAPTSLTPIITYKIIEVVRRSTGRLGRE